jgi:hypothetical protein
VDGEIFLSATRHGSATLTLPGGARALLFIAVSFAALFSGCRLDMHVQPRYNPYDPSSFFADGRSARQPVPGTIPRGAVLADDAGPDRESVTTRSDTFPFLVTRAVLDRGRERYNIFCAPCHGLAGDGDGMIVHRGFQAPPSYHIDSLRRAPASHFFEVITDGFGAMYPYGYRVPPRDRWAIVAYIRALQLSRQANIAAVPGPERQKLMSAPPGNTP